MKRVLPWLVQLIRAGTRDFGSALAALVGPVKNNLFPHRTVFHHFILFVPVLGRLSLKGEI
jgi:hypothetical protein